MIKCIAIDDEPIALDIIRRFCEKRGGISIETFSNPLAGMKRVSEWKPDIVMLDIEMNGASGLELAKHLPPTTCLIFTTAYAQYAIDGFEANAVDFLHKPFFYERFARAIQKAEKWLHMHDLLRRAESASRQLLLKSEYKTVAVSIDNIIYIESIDNYVKLHLADGTSLLSKISLRGIEEQLPQGEFLRIHRSFVVARNRISSFTRSEVNLVSCPQTLPIGRKYANDLVREIKNGGF